jgi:CHAD domain-containing protein
MAKPAPLEGLDPEASVLDSARRILPIRLDEVYAHADAVDNPAAAEQHHDMRIAAKRLRYTMETFRPIFPREFKLLIKQVRQLQDILGRVHDYDVFVPFFVDYLEHRRRQSDADLQRAAFERNRNDPDEPAPTLRDVREVLSSASGAGEREALLRLIERTRARRVSAFVDFQAYWSELEEGGFRSTLLGMITTQHLESTQHD